jgi:hypothetical protein
VELIFLNISSKVLTLNLGLEPDIFTLQANSSTTVLLTVNDKLVNQSLILFVRILMTDKRFLMKLLGGKHAGTWLMGKNHKHYWRRSMSQTKTCTLTSIFIRKESKIELVV